MTPGDTTTGGGTTTDGGTISDGGGDTDATETGGTGATTSSTSTTSSVPYECPNGVLENDPLPSSVDGNTADGFAQQAAVCDNGGTAGRELAYTFTAPESGFFEFKTSAEDPYADTVIFLTEGEDCGGKQIACGDDMSADPGGPIPTTAVATWLEQDEVVQAVVDTKALTLDVEFTLTVDAVEGECPDEVITETELPITINGSTSGSSNRMTSTCYGEAFDYIYQWTAPQAATFQFDTIGSSVTHEDTVISVLDGDCGGEELACNDDIVTGQDRDAKVEVDLAQDQVVIIVVDGWSGDINGDFVLNISIAE
jgi:hypothetical protein